MGRLRLSGVGGRLQQGVSFEKSMRCAALEAGL